MNKKSLNVVMIFVLLFSFIGISGTKIYCTPLKSKIEGKCCSKQSKEKGCCQKLITLNRLTSDINAVDASMQLQNFLSSAVLLFIFNVSASERGNKLSGHLYVSPSIIPDISVLYQIFRI